LEEEKRREKRVLIGTGYEKGGGKLVVKRGYKTGTGKWHHNLPP